MKHTYEISHLAHSDLENIWRYTYEEWSLSQANRYYDSLICEFLEICKYPEIGREIREIKQGHRIRLIQSHMIVYKIEKEKIWIDRILHQEMDIESQLAP